METQHLSPARQAMLALTHQQVADWQRLLDRLQQQASLQELAYCRSRITLLELQQELIYTRDFFPGT